MFQQAIDVPEHILYLAIPASKPVGDHTRSIASGGLPQKTEELRSGSTELKTTVRFLERVKRTLRRRWPLGTVSAVPRGPPPGLRQQCQRLRGMFKAALRAGERNADDVLQAFAALVGLADDTVEIR